MFHTAIRGQKDIYYTVTGASVASAAPSWSAVCSVSRILYISVFTEKGVAVADVDDCCSCTSVVVLCEQEEEEIRRDEEKALSLSTCIP